MKLTWFLISLLFVVAAVADDEELTLADNCDPQACQLPDCRCSSTTIPGGLEARDTPQFVLVTFDDNVNSINIETYRNSLYGRTNSNGCNVGATWYVCHEYTNYQLVNELYNNGFEIALHSITHQTPPSYWAEATKEILDKEFADQRNQMSHFANIPVDSLQGIRMPFLQLSGNASFEVMKDIGMTYDCSWPTTNSGMWPYTLDYASTQECPIPPCPSASLPGQWVIPMISWRDLNGSPCSMADGCYTTPPMNDEDAWYKFIIGNFERHYLDNHAPFGFFVHEWYIRTNPAVHRAFDRFLDTMNNLPDVFMVNSKDVIDWVKDPVPVDEYRAKACQTRATANCAATNCGPLSSPHTEEQFWMGICTQCPRVYPWIENPLGQ